MSEPLFKVSQAEIDQMVKKINFGTDLLPEQAIKQDVIVDFTCGICLTVVKDMVECHKCNGLSC